MFIVLNLLASQLVMFKNVCVTIGITKGGQKDWDRKSILGSQRYFGITSLETSTMIICAPAISSVLVHVATVPKSLSR